MQKNDIYSNDIEGAAYFEDNRARDSSDYETLTERDFAEENYEEEEEDNNDNKE